MEYKELIAQALKGRSVNCAAKELGIAQRSLDRYVKGDRLPDYTTAAKLGREAGLSLGETMAVLIKEEERRKPLKEIVSAVFLQLTNTLNRLFVRVSVE